MANNIQRSMEAAANPTSTKTPATAPVFRKKLLIGMVLRRTAGEKMTESTYDDLTEVELFGLSVGLLMPTCVMVTTPPLLAVEVSTVVTIDGALVVNPPR
jgi:hypothetical protein